MPDFVPLTEEELEWLLRLNDGDVAAACETALHLYVRLREAERERDDALGMIQTEATLRDIAEEREARLRGALDLCREFFAGDLNHERSVPARDALAALAAEEEK